MIIGIDVGGSTTKICGFRTATKELMKPAAVKASDPLASIYGAFGKFTSEYSIELREIENVLVTGVGSSYVTKPLYGLNTKIIPEFKAIGLGGLYLSGLDKAVTVSMGTGTAIVLADNEKCLYLGGTGVGGGTLMGLSKMLLNMDNIDNIEELANGGDLKNIDLRLSDITKRDIIPGLPDHLTVSNFGKTSDIANKSDTALGIINLVFETIGMISIFAARQYDIKDIILTGNMTKVPQAKSIFQGLNEMFKINFIIPEMSQYGPVIGAALCHYNDE